MQNQNALVVGGTKGIGREVVRQLAHKGYCVLFVGRDAGAGKALEDELRAVSKVEFVQGDMSSLKDTRRVALRIGDMLSHINILVHSADVLMMERVNSDDGHELSFAINYLSRFLMNDLLLNHLKAGKARILHIAAPGMSTLKESQFPPGPEANGWIGHGVGQGANDVYGIEMAERLKGSGVTINILNPGGVDTEIRDRMILRGWQKVVFPIVMPLIMRFVFRMEMAQPADYARIPVEFATDPKHAGLTGTWIKWDRTFFPQKPGQYPAEMRSRIWQVSERLVAAYRAAPETAPA